MSPRKYETRLAYFTLAMLLIYVPGETWVSWRHGLLDPFYLVDLVAMILLFAGAIHSLRARPHPAPGVLCAGYAWAAANGWRATSWRWVEVRQGGELDYGSPELWTVAIGTGLFLVCFAISLFLVVRQGRAG